jgi:hypothetical protein
MKDNPKLGVKRKMQKSVKHKIEEEKVIEAFITNWQVVVTHWQEIEKHIRVNQWQEQEDPHSKVSLKIHLDLGNNFRVSIDGEHTGYIWIYLRLSRNG